MPEPNFKDVWKWGAITALTFILGFAANDLAKLPSGLKYLWILILAGLFFASVAIVQTAWKLTPKFLENLRNLKPENLRIYPGSLHGNIYTLNFKVTEWRHPFRKTEAFVNMQRMVSLGTDISDQGVNLEWRKQKIREPLKIARFFSYELNFLKVYPKNNTFHILAENNEKFKFVPGEYGFKLGLAANVLGNFKVKNKFLNRIGIPYIGFKHFRREVYLIVSYEGDNQISAWITDERGYQDKYWYEQLTKNRI
jgi:hypothetical protein